MLERRAKVPRPERALREGGHHISQGTLLHRRSHAQTMRADSWLTPDDRDH